MGKGSDWIKNKTREVLKGFLSRQPGNISQQSLNQAEYITFTNGQKTRGKTDSGIEVDVIPIGRLRTRELGILVGPKQFLCKGPSVRYKSIDGGQENGYLIASTMENYYIRKLPSIDKFTFNSPNINTYASAPASSRSRVINGSAMSGSFFMDKSTLFVYSSRKGGPLFPGNPDLLDGEFEINWADLKGWSLDQETSTVIWNEMQTHVYKLERDFIEPCPVPENDNVYVMSLTLTQDESMPYVNIPPWTLTNNNSAYVWTRTQNVTWEEDNDPYLVDREAILIDRRPGAFPEDFDVPQECCLINRQTSQVDAMTAFLETSRPLQKKRTLQESWNYVGTQTRTVSGSDETRDWEMSLTIDYTYLPTDPDTGERVVRRDYSYTITQSGVFSDGLFAHGPCEIPYMELFFGFPVQFTEFTPINALVDPFSDVYQQDLGTAETGPGSILSSLPFTATTFTEISEPATYDGPIRQQMKFVSVTDMSGAATVASPLYYDQESYDVETTINTTGTLDPDSSGPFTYDNTFFGGGSAYDAIGNFNIDYDLNEIDTDGFDVEHFNQFPTFDYDIQIPIITGGFKTTNYTHFLVSSIPHVAKYQPYSTFNSLLPDVDPIPYNFYIATSTLTLQGDATVVFSIPDIVVGALKFYSNPNQVVVLGYIPDGFSEEDNLAKDLEISKFTYNSESNEWKRSSIKRDIPVGGPVGGLGGQVIDYGIL